MLKTERLILRGWRDADLDAFAAMSADPEVARFIGGPVDRENAWRMMARNAGHWLLRGYGNWVVTRRGDGAILGRAGLWNPEGWPGVEVGWMLARFAWGHGYAAEAGGAAIEWAWRTLDAARLISCIDPRNAASARVAERLGMQIVGDRDLRGTPVDIWGLDRPG